MSSKIVSALENTKETIQLILYSPEEDCIVLMQCCKRVVLVKYANKSTIVVSLWQDLDTSTFVTGSVFDMVTKQQYVVQPERM